MRDLLELLERGGVVLTANARAARALHRAHADAQSGSLSAWHTPRILDLESWLGEQWHALLLTGTEDRLLLNSAQETAIWERIVASGVAGRSLIAPDRMTGLAQQAYQLLAAHEALDRLEDAAWTSDPHSESELFRQWARSFRDQCRGGRWLPRCELIDVVTRALRSRTLLAPERVGWLGFDRHTPAQEALSHALDEAGAAQQTIAWDSRIAEPRLHAAASAAGEADACADWVQRQLQNNPAARIGIVAPELSGVRPLLERSLLRTLAPQSFPITAEAAALPFEFALGIPLSQTPLVHAALLLLRWLQAPLPQQEITWLLLSSTLGTLQQPAAREAAAQWDARLRDAACAPPEMSLDSLLRQRGANAPAIAPFREQLYAMQQTYRRYSHRASPSGWIARIDELLGLAQWGAMGGASSLVYQARQRWVALLEGIASLDFAGRLYSYAELLATLERIAAQTIFAPESEDAPVQVMSVFAAAGQVFDGVWFLSASDAQWPAPSRAHPLLPLWLQRELAMPHATPAIDSELAHRVTARLLSSAGEVVFSYASQNAEAVVQQPSPLVQSLQELQYVPAVHTYQSVILEDLPDEAWIPHPDPAAAKGGQRALKQQADCPFQAFASQRLGTRELRIAGRGLSAIERGNLLHRVMEKVWSEDAAGGTHPHDSVTLRAAMNNGSLRSLVAAHAEQAFAAIDADRSEVWQRAYLAQEQARLVELVMEWLNFEATRRDFRVAEVEKDIKLHIGELALTARADRIDEVAEGRILLDYKTGEVSPSSWEGARPEEPQLPLYAAFGDVEQLVGALFAQVRPGKIDLQGHIVNAQTNLLASLGNTSPLVKFPYSHHLVEGWRATLTALAESFVRGEAQVDPRTYPRTCQYCALPGLCRIAESGRARTSSSEDAEESS